MKMKTISVLFFLLFFAAGFGVVLTTPTEVRADQPCENDPHGCGFSFTCVNDVTCPPNFGRSFKMWKDPADIDCTGPYSCVGEDRGCVCLQL